MQSKINLSKPYRVLIGRQTNDVYIVQGDPVIEEQNDTVIVCTPEFRVGQRVKIDPSEIGGYFNMQGTVERLYLSTDPDTHHAYGVRVQGVYGVFGEDELRAASITN